MEMCVCFISKPVMEEGETEEGLVRGWTAQLP